MKNPALPPTIGPAAAVRMPRAPATPTSNGKIRNNITPGKKMSLPSNAKAAGCKNCG